MAKITQYKKPVTKDYMWCDSIFMCTQNRQIYKQMGGSLGLKGAGGEELGDC